MLARKVGRPSTVLNRLQAPPLMPNTGSETSLHKRSNNSRFSATVKGNGGGSAGSLKAKIFKSGYRISLSLGTVHSRTTGGEGGVMPPAPARKNTGADFVPDCPILQLSCPLLPKGFLWAGMAVSHCHHLADHSP